MGQFQNVPGPAQADFDTLSEQMANLTPGTTYTTLVSDRFTYTSTASYKTSFTLTKPSSVVATQNYNNTAPTWLAICTSSSSSVLANVLACTNANNGQSIVLNAILPAGTFYLWGAANSAAGAGNDTIVKACAI